MSTFPVPLDSLISYIKALHPDADPLQNLTDAMTVSNQLDEQADALIGHFVDQARRSGASWAQIGESIGVTKQAAQKRFVRDLLPEGNDLFSRFTPRARNALNVAGRYASGKAVHDTHLAAGLLHEPKGLAAVALHLLGLTDEQIYGALKMPETIPDGEVSLEELDLDDSVKSSLKETLKSALRYGHNYIGTEHLLMGIVSAEGPAARALRQVGVEREAIEARLLEVLKDVQSKMQ